jgi:flagellin
MGFRINTNVAAMNAHMHSVNNNVGLNKSLSALSSGHRINKAADDASGLAIANKLSAQAEGLGQAVRNSNDAIGLIQTADGALEEYGNILKRVRTLATQAANDTQSTASRAAISDEITALMSEANDIAKTTRFNGMKILDGSHNSGKFVFHTGAYANETQNITINNAQVGTVSGTTTHTVNTITNAETTISNMDIAITAIDKLRSKLGAQQNKLESTVRNISVTQINVTAAESQIRDVDFAEESANLQKHNILAQSGTYAMSQANQAQQNVMRLLQ